MTGTKMLRENCRKESLSMYNCKQEIVNVAFLDTKSTFTAFDREITIESKSASSKQPVKNFGFKEFWIDFSIQCSIWQIWQRTV